MGEERKGSSRTWSDLEGSRTTEGIADRRRREGGEADGSFRVLAKNGSAMESPTS